MHLAARTLEVVAVSAAGAALLALLLCLLLLVRTGRLRRLVEGAGSAAGPGAGGRPGEVDALREQVRLLRADLAAARPPTSDALRHVAVVRYDAFGDMGGRMSFSAALLDDAGDGLVLTSINGRSETRTYAKGVTGGRSEHSLSPEEEQAVGHARTGSRPAGPAAAAELAAPGRRRRSHRD